MRISEIDLQTEDIMWFSVDNNGNIFECTSAGCGNVPEYVCCSRENTDILLDYFTNEAPIVTNSILLIPEEDNFLTQDVKDLSSKGLYCYDVNENDDTFYTCVAKPEKPITINELPAEIQKILSLQRFDGNIPELTEITVPHAY